MITGYNIGGYDLPLLLERAEVLGRVPLPFGRDGSGLRRSRRAALEDLGPGHRGRVVVGAA